MPKVIIQAECKETDFWLEIRIDTNHKTFSCEGSLPGNRLTVGDDTYEHDYAEDVPENIEPGITPIRLR